MKRFTLWALSLTLLLAMPYAVAEDNKEKEKSTAKVETDQEKVSYAIGMQIGTQMKQGEIDLDIPAFSAAISDMLGDKTPALTMEDAQAAMMKFQMAQQEKAQAAGAEARAEGVAFLADKEKEDGVKKTESGLLYKVVTTGTGDKSPAASDRVKVHYTGTFIDGEVFDSSVERGEPAEFGVGQVIKGWTEALQLMKVGDKFELWIPSDIAYGEGGNRGIPPNSVLHFTVELLDIMAAPAAPLGSL